MDFLKNFDNAFSEYIKLNNNGDTGFRGDDTTKVSNFLSKIGICGVFVDEEKLKLKMAERKAKATNTDGTRKKSKFQEKLEEMQRKQQEMLKNKKR
jgi:hypothetical protein